jgi:uncharacterized RDD family membrane protein YckC
MLMLYRLGAQDWEKQGRLPDAIPVSDDVSLSLAGVGGVPLVAHRLDSRHIRIYRQTGSAPAVAWDVLADVTSDADIAEYKLLGGTAAPMLWYRGSSGPGHLWIAPTSGKPVEQQLSAPGGVPHAIAVANGAVRELWIADGKIFDQRLNALTGAPEGPPVPAVLPAVSLYGTVVRALQLTLAVALVLALAASMRRRGELSDGEFDPTRFHLAPFSLRLVAGLIDLIPLIATLVILWLRTPTAAAAQPPLSDWIILAAGVAAYLILTTAVELAAGRSIGKLLTGLHIVGLDGRPATPGARLLRNVFRVIDLIICGMPLALILFSPLRQRAGDLGAGTVVVKGRPDESSDSSGDSPQRPRTRGTDTDSE